MKKMVCLTAFLLLASVLLCGCADRQEKTHNVQPGETIGEVSTEPGATEPGTSLPDQQNATGNVSAVTLEELEKLKADIEGLKPEDPGGLSGE